MKVARGFVIPVDNSDGPLRAIQVPASTTTYTTGYLSGVIGDPNADLVTLPIGFSFKDVNGNYYDVGYATSQAGAYQFNTANVGATTTTLTRSVLKAVSSGTLAAKQCNIRAVTPSGTSFFASRITNNYVWNGTTRYRYVAVTEAIRTLVINNTAALNTNTNNVVAIFLSTNTYALVRGI